MRVPLHRNARIAADRRTITLRHLRTLFAAVAAHRPGALPTHTRPGIGRRAA